MTAAVIERDDADVLRRNAVSIVILLAVAASISGITNGFALDDIHIIVQNSHAHSLHYAIDVFTRSYWPADKGGALYRPLTSLAFLIQWVIGRGSPLPFHMVNIALYAAVSAQVLKLGRTLVRWETALLAAALFAVHPVHVEVVANVVGQAELWAALLALPALTLFIEARRSGTLSRKDIAAITMLYAAALMFKEHVVVLPAVLLAAEIFLANRATRDVRALGILAAAMIAVALVFVVVRASVIGDVAGAGVSPIFADSGYRSRVFTMLLAIMEWVRLFFWPARMASDYAPLIQVTSSFNAAMVPSILVLLGLTAVAVAARKTKPVATFALTFTGITLLIPSNLVVMTGFVVAERALFLPSVGVVIAAAVLVEALVERSGEENPQTNRYALAAIALVLAFGVIRSTARNGAWRDNAALIEASVEDLPASWHAHMMMAQLHSERGQPAHALEETELAVKLGSPTDFHLLAFAADMYQMYGRCDVAMRYYDRSLSIAPDQPQVRTNAAICAQHFQQSVNVR